MGANFGYNGHMKDAVSASVQVQWVRILLSVCEKIRKIFSSYTNVFDHDYFNNNKSDIVIPKSGCVLISSQ